MNRSLTSYRKQANESLEPVLVLTRKVNESIRVGDGVIFTVLENSGGQVKIGISAPRNLPIHREEVYLRIRDENLAAASIDFESLLENAPPILQENSGQEDVTDAEPGNPS
ncbi:carbon storage regulator CsrA [Candidatus Neomarinimicrobiota bacterium]